MIRLLGQIPKQFFLACSGGIDSMVALDFFLNGRRKPVVVHFDHDTDYGRQARRFVKKKCRALDVPIIISRIGRDRRSKESNEVYWRNERYTFFDNIGGPIVTVHHLDDAAEWWIFSSLHGKSKLIPYCRDNVIRPFLLTPKSELVSWAERKGVEYMDDPSNHDERYMRSIVRHKILPEALRVNPGLRTVVRKKIKEENANI
jgi:tRNA(Ile)-lysidine synthase